MTRTTIAALAIVEAIEGTSWSCQYRPGVVLSKGLTHQHDIPFDSVAKRQISRNGNKDID
jgi:hypothetical protein